MRCLSIRRKYPTLNSVKAIPNVSVNQKAEVELHEMTFEKYQSYMYIYIYVCVCDNPYGESLWSSAYRQYVSLMAYVVTYISCDREILDPGIEW